uniref:Uncharacterized protein n=1 Tax=Odontella aurita TaxID=265563 RepID=A0A7S4K5Q0_9STRA
MTAAAPPSATAPPARDRHLFRQPYCTVASLLPPLLRLSSSISLISFPRPSSSLLANTPPSSPSAGSILPEGAGSVNVRLTPALFSSSSSCSRVLLASFSAFLLLPVLRIPFVAHPNHPTMLAPPPTFDPATPLDAGRLLRLFVDVRDAMLLIDDGSWHI